MSTLVDVHKCVKKGPVVIVANTVTRSNESTFVVLTAHDPKCKGAKW